MPRLMFKLIGMLVTAGVVWWRLEGGPLPGFLSDDGGEYPGYALSTPGDGSSPYGTGGGASMEAATIAIGQIQQALENAQQGGGQAAVRHIPGCSTGVNGCAAPADAAEPARPAMPSVVTGRSGGSGAPGGVTVVRPRN